MALLPPSITGPLSECSSSIPPSFAPSQYLTVLSLPDGGALFGSLEV